MSRVAGFILLLALVWYSLWCSGYAVDQAAQWMLP